MEEKKYILCGGTFFDLLIQARRQRTSARKRTDGEKDGLSDREMLEALIKVAFPDFTAPAGRSMSTYTSSYKSCRLSSNEYLPFENTELVSNFDRLVKEDYGIALKRMSNFSEQFLDEKGMGNWLVRAIMETVHYDDSITDEVFYIDGPGQEFDKKHLTAAENISLQAFLLGIWHFIVTERPDNTVGAATYDAWNKKSSSLRGKRTFVSDIGKTWNKRLELNLSPELFYDFGDEDADEEDGTVPEGMVPIILPGAKVAPEITEDPPYILVRKDILEPEKGRFDEYLENAYEKYSKLKTLLYNDVPREFYQFYVCNNISQRVYIRRLTYTTKTIPHATAATLEECSNFVLITGTGGLGKSMMMRHLLLDSIKKYEDGSRLPIFIPLKDFDNTYEDLSRYIFEKFESLGGADAIDDFIEILESGQCLLLLDGLDEIKSDYRKKFEHDLDVFTDKYKDNMFVISSRPVGSFVSLNRFTILELQPFTKDQALELIDKLDFRSDEPSIKAKFRKELDTRLFITHREFTENPLLLTIMLMTYEQFAEVPSKMHIFYREAYVALSQKHDASKGGFRRDLKTGLTADQFADYFAEFCARTYRDEKFELREVEFEKYFNALHEKKKGPPSISASDFRDDLVENMCLMFYEGGKYHFTHRSFQEYFCAVYFSKQKDKYLQQIGDFFEHKRTRNYTDKTFDMLYDMIPEKIQEYIFEPYLTQLFDECDSGSGYWTFLEKMYPILYYEKGDTEGCDDNEPQSFLYGFMARTERFEAVIDGDDLPCDERFQTNEWGYLDHRFHSPDYEDEALIDLDDLPWEYEDEFGEPDPVGWNYELHIDKIAENPKLYDDVGQLLTSGDFPLKKEYEQARLFLDELRSKREPEGDDLFDLFG